MPVEIVMLLANLQYEERLPIQKTLVQADAGDSPQAS